jgi:uncharacterized protein (TIGR03083 family)
MGTPDIEWLAEGLRVQTGAFADAVDGADPDTCVPTCPQWLLRDLVAHIGQADRWAAGLVRTRAAAPIPDPRDADPGAPQEWSGWLRDGAAELVGAVQNADAETMVWTFMGPRPAVFWLRRMLHDTSVHHADAALTVGTPFEITPDLAADAISEGLEMLSAPGAQTLKPALAELNGQGQTLQLRPEDRSRAGWLITRTPGGVTWDRSTADGDVVVTGAVADLLLVFTRRLPADDHRVKITGDRPLLDHWLTNTAFE